MIKVRIPQKGEEIEVPGPRLVSDILARTGHRPGAVLVRQGKSLLTRDRRVEDGAEIEIVSVVSGG